MIDEQFSAMVWGKTLEDPCIRVLCVKQENTEFPFKLSVNRMNPMRFYDQKMYIGCQWKDFNQALTWFTKVYPVLKQFTMNGSVGNFPTLSLEI
jgi:hypothetical protein